MMTCKAVAKILEEYENLTTLEKTFLRRELKRAQKRPTVLTEKNVSELIIGIQMHRIINA